MSNSVAGPTGPAAPPDAQSGRRWLILFVGLIAMTAGCTFQYGLPNFVVETCYGDGWLLEVRGSGQRESRLAGGALRCP
jgi:hypothetical protein